MQYLRCKCGSTQTWTSMGAATCHVCGKCGSTLGPDPDAHPDPTPHRVTASIHGTKLMVKCDRCQGERPLVEATNLLPLWDAVSAISSQIDAAINERITGEKC